eukprot:g22196.t1
MEDPSEAARQNLAHLSEAQGCAEHGDWAGALLALEAATEGDATRSDTAEWLRQVRRAMLWHQTFRALHAKARAERHR